MKMKRFPLYYVNKIEEDVAKVDEGKKESSHVMKKQLYIIIKSYKNLIRRFPGPSIGAISSDPYSNAKATEKN